MRWHIRRITRRHKLGVAHEDQSIESDRIRCGRGSDVDLHLPDLTVALHHAEFVALPDGAVACTALSRAGITHAGLFNDYAEIARGDSVVIGRYRVTVIDAIDDADVTLEVEAVGADLKTQGAGVQQAPSRARKRTLAFSLAGAVIVLFLLLPASTWFGEAWRDTLRATGLASDLSWNSGPLASAHQMYSSDCEVCHVKPFRRTTNVACEQCHDDVAGHGPPVPEPQRCGTCHREHSGDDGLIHAGASDCGSCHGDIRHASADATVADVTDFAADHPQFRVSLSAPPDPPRRVRLDDDARLTDASGLLFSHAAHLDPAGTKRGDDIEHLRCADCHVPAEGRAQMRPVDMETHCQRCHRLDFDPSSDREVPHADIPTVMQTLREFYAATALAGGYTGYVGATGPERADADRAPPPPDFVTRRRPGRVPSEAERHAADAWAAAMATFVGGELVQYRACALCHELAPAADPAGPRLRNVAVITDFMPGARFDHAKHETRQCEDCHRAGESKDSRDVLMPGIDTCRRCHGGALGARGRIASDCVDCHRYHGLGTDARGDE